MACSVCGKAGHYAPTRPTVVGLASNVRYKTESGWPSSLDVLWRRIGAFTRSDRISGWKVGISANPDRRAWQHERDGGGYDEMVVIYVTRSIKNARVLEHQVTVEYEGYHDNERRGGGGMEADATEHYVYLLLRY